MQLAGCDAMTLSPAILKELTSTPADPGGGPPAGAPLTPEAAAERRAAAAKDGSAPQVHALRSREDFDAQIQARSGVVVLALQPPADAMLLRHLCGRPAGGSQLLTAGFFAAPLRLLSPAARAAAPGRGWPGRSSRRAWSCSGGTPRRSRRCCARW